jgi:cold shock CspA family protein
MSPIKRGTVRAWFPARNFGFVSETGTGIDAFAHVSAFEFDRNLIEVGMLVEYEVVGRKHKGGDALGAINIHPRSNPAAKILAADDIPAEKQVGRAAALEAAKATAKTHLSSDSNSESRRGE